MKILIKIAAIVTSVMLAVSVSGCGLFSGKDDTDGLTAYDIAVKHGFAGTEEEWLESLNGKDGDNAQTIYKSLYEDAVENGFDGSFEEFIKQYYGEEFLNIVKEYVDREINTPSPDSAADVALFSTIKMQSDFSYTYYTYDRRGNKIENKEDFSSLGSGVIVELDEERGDAYILTNFHTVYSPDDDDGWADKIKVYVYGRELEKCAVEATVVGGTSTYDISVIKVEGSEIFKNSNLRAATFADPDDVAPGDSVIAVGNSNGEGISVTSGIVSVDSEYIQMTSPRDEKTLVQYRVMRIDAAVNGGNSGGGLFNMNGELAGIVNAKTISEGVENMAYSIPIALVKNLYDNIMRNCNGEDKSVKRCLIGVTVTTADSYAYYDKLLGETKIKETVEVSSVEATGVAQGRLMVGDVIKSIEYKGMSIEADRLFKVTDCSLLFAPGDTVKYVVDRNGSEVSVTLTLGSATVID